MYQLWVLQQVTWNVTEHLTDGINGKYAVYQAVTEHCRLPVSIRLHKSLMVYSSKPGGGKTSHSRKPWPQIPPSPRGKAAGTWRQPHNPFQILGCEWEDLYVYSTSVLYVSLRMNIYFARTVPQVPVGFTINKTQFRKRWIKNYRTLLLVLSAAIGQDRWIFQLLRVYEGQ